MASSMPAPFKAMQGASPSAVPDDRLSGAAVVTRKSATWGNDRSIDSSLSMHDGHHDQLGGESKLTESHDCRHTRLQVVPEPSALFTDPTLAIPAASTNDTYNLFGQDVSGFVNNSASLTSASLTPRHSVYSSQSLETSVSNLFNFDQYGITKSNNRPRTSDQVFKTGEELALHYGIPTLLPPPPQTTPRSKQKQQQPEQSTALDFDTLRLNYLSMISQKSSDNTMTVDNTLPSSADLLPSSHMGQTESALDEWVNSITSMSITSSTLFDELIDSDPKTASPQFEFLTSPALLGTPVQDFESSPNETPFSDFLNTPLLNNSDELFHSPAMESDLPLFGTDEYYTLSVKTKTAELPELPDLFYVMPPIPGTEGSIDPTSIYPSPVTPCTPSTSNSTPVSAPTNTASGVGARRRSNATGTRKNITPEKLIPLDAPTQPRRYVATSATSRKEIPSMFLKKRQRAEMEDEEDELLEPLPPNATEREQIEYKRRQNTLAARKSRKRKLMHQQELENKVETLTNEVTRWQTRCDVMSQMLESHGIPPPTFSD